MTRIFETDDFSGLLPAPKPPKFTPSENLERTLRSHTHTGHADYQGEKVEIKQGYLNQAADALAESASEIERLREALREHAVCMEYDCPGDAPEPCGMWCLLCNQHVDDDKIGNHDPSCLLFAQRSEPIAQGLEDIRSDLREIVEGAR